MADLFHQFFGDFTTWPQRATAEENWEEKVKKDFANAIQCIVFNISPPGAGKTFLWSKETEKLRYCFVSKKKLL